MQDISPANASISEELKEEIALFRMLRPYIAHCLNLNHEINNALSGVIGFAECMLMDEDGLSDSHRAYVQNILACGEKIQKLVEKLCHEKIELYEKLDLGTISKRFEVQAKRSN